MDSTHNHPEPSENEIEKELKEVFEKMPAEIPIFLFARPGKNDVYADAARNAIAPYGDIIPRERRHRRDRFLGSYETEKPHFQKAGKLVIDEPTGPSHTHLKTTP